MALLKTWTGSVQRLLNLRRSARARASTVNALSGVADYLAQPIAMLLAAPFLLRRMGVSEFGLWILVCAAVGGGSTLAIGFGDAAMKYISLARGKGDWPGVVSTVRSAMTINLLLGLIVGTALWIAAPYTVHHVFKIDARSYVMAIRALRVGSVLLLVRSVESVLVNNLRAFEQYLPSVTINIVSRSVIICVAVFLVARGGGVLAIMAVTLTLSCVAMFLQACAVWRYVGKMKLLPSFNKAALSKIVSFGSFSWLQALSALVFSQVDRLVIGAVLGTSAVAYYSVCTQVAQPIHGITAASLHFLFPHLSTRHATESSGMLRRAIVAALRLNLLIAVTLTVPVALFGKSILRLWMGAAFTTATGSTLSLLAIAFGLLAMNVTAHYSMLALGQIRYLTCLNLVAGAATILVLSILVRHEAISGAAAARLLYGPLTWVMYLKIHSLLSEDSPCPVQRLPELIVAGEEEG